MANIRDFIEKIGIARYGNDVRSSIMNALMAVNDESEKSVLLVNQSVEKANEASNVALEASNTANDLTSRAEIVIVEAEQSASDAEQSSIQAGEKAELAERNAKISQSYAVGGTGTRENEDIDNAMYYYMQAKHISQGNNGLVPMGTITFEELPISDITQNAMYNISNAFTSDERFLDGGGLNYGAGSNVYYTVNGKWDVLAASSVNGVKGNKESEYRQGNVNITPENIGALPEDGNAVSATKATQDSNGNNIVETYRTKTGDTADNVVSFASGDSVNPTGWEDINVVESGETHGSLFRKISLAIKNLRYLYNMIGTADIAAIGDGTIKGAITGLNNNISWKLHAENSNVKNNLITADLPSIFNELYVIIETGTYAWRIPIIIPKITISDVEKPYYTGYYDGNIYIGANFIVSLTQITCGISCIDNISKVFVYYR